MLSIEEVRARIEAIKEIADDNESAHAREDRLHIDVLRAIADGECLDPAGCAGAALETLNIDFDRWCA